MLNLQNSYLSAREIPILVVPIGKVPSHKFKYYLDVIKCFAKNDLKEISSDFMRGTTARARFYWCTRTRTCAHTLGHVLTYEQLHACTRTRRRTRAPTHVLT